jgi:hypothetical protein
MPETRCSIRALRSIHHFARARTDSLGLSEPPPVAFDVWTSRPVEEIVDGTVVLIGHCVAVPPLACPGPHACTCARVFRECVCACVHPGGWGESGELRRQRLDKCAWVSGCVDLTRTCRGRNPGVSASLASLLLLSPTR